MGLIGAILRAPAVLGAIGSGVATLAKGVSPPAAAYQTAPTEDGAAFQSAPPGRFDRFVNGLNRLPRPMLALGTLALFVYAMIDPAGFAARMVGLNAAPEPLWWLLGAIVGFYFGAREFHYSRARAAAGNPAAAPPEDNPALSELIAKSAAGAAPAR